MGGYRWVYSLWGRWQGETGISVLNTITWKAPGVGVLGLAEGVTEVDAWYLTAVAQAYHKLALKDRLETLLRWGDRRR